MIKKFKNGKVLLKPDKVDYTDGTLDESFYHDDMFMSDLSIQDINGFKYIVDFNKSLVYELGSYLMQNPLKYILEELEEKGKMYLYPLSTQDSLALIDELNGSEG